MDRYTAIEYAKQRMKDIGKRVGDYHIKPVVVVGTQQERTAKQIIIQAHNQYYILVRYWMYSGLEIFSDTGYFNSDDYTNNTTTQEFTGEIIIKQLPQKIWSIEKNIADGIKQYPINFISVTF